MKNIYFIIQINVKFKNVFSEINEMILKHHDFKTMMKNK